MVHDQVKENGMNDQIENINRNPVWHSPAWITAMVGLISIFFTVPEVIGNYLAKEQEIDLVSKEIELAEIKNRDLEKSNYFKSLITVLQVNQKTPRPDKDRAITLRFIFHTAEDPKIKKWAEAELIMMDAKP